MNAHIDKNGNCKFSLNKPTNRNDEYLEDISLENRLARLNTKFLKKWEEIIDLHPPK